MDFGPFRLIELVPMSGVNGKVYTIHYERSKMSEFERFVSDPKMQSHKDFNETLQLIRTLAGKDGAGFSSRFFQHKGEYQKDSGGEDVLGYAKAEKSRFRFSLRLYVARLSKNVLILGGGCIKPGGGPLAKFRNCRYSYDRIRLAYEKIQESIDAGTTHVRRGGINGTIEFGQKNG